MALQPPTKLIKPPPPPVDPATLFTGKSGRLSAFEASLEFFLHPIMPFFRDPDVSEIMVNGADQIYIEKAGRITLTNATFASETDVRAAASNIAQFVGQDLSLERPLLDGRLPDGSRVCIVFGAIASKGTQISIRRFARAAVTPEFLLQRDAITPMAVEFLMLAVKAHRNIIVSGGSGSGKTTLVNVLTLGIADDERIIVIEDTRELQVQRPHVLQLEARPADAYGRGQVTVRELFITALRMRPDRLVVGEVRRGEALDMLQAMTSGHHGSMTTLHASSPVDTCHRLETMALMADVAIPLFALRRQIASAIDLIVQTARHSDGRRNTTAISEVHFDEKADHYVINDIFSMTGEGNDRKLVYTGNSSDTLKLILAEGLRDQMVHTQPMLSAAGAPTGGF